MKREQLLPRSFEIKEVACSEVQLVGYLNKLRPIQYSNYYKMKTNSSAPQTLYLGLDVHKAETVVAILESDRDAEPRHYGSVTTSQHALERVMRRIAKSQKRELSDLHVFYEASGWGFGLRGGSFE